MANSILRASVTADTLTGWGDAATVLVDGADTAITANGLANYAPTPGDRLLVQQVGTVVEILQFLSRGTVPFATTDQLDAVNTTATDALNNAATAQTAANNAQTTATNAQTSADAAATAANNAQASADAAQATANGKNTVTYSATTPTGTPNAGDLWFQFQAGVVIGQWVGSTASPSVWTAAPIDNAVIADIDAGKVTAGILSANRIGANTMTADKLLIGVGPNVIANPGAETGSTSPHVMSSATGFTTATNPVRSGLQGFRIVCPTRTAGGFLIVMNGQPTNTSGVHMPVAAGDQIHAEFYARAGTVNGQNVQLYADIRDSSGTHLGYGGSSDTTVLTTAYQLISTDFTIDPVAYPTAAYVALAVGSSSCTAGDVIHVDDVWMSKKITGELLVDGAIDGKTITGPVIQTSSSGNRMVMWNDGSEGTIDFYSGASGETRGQINPGSSAGQPYLNLQTSHTASGVGSEPATLVLWSSTSGVDPTALFSLTDVSVDDAGTGIGGNLQVTKSIQVAGTTKINGFDHGAISANTSDSNGTVVVNHGLGVTPVSVTATTRLRNHAIQVYSISATTITFRLTAGDTNTPLSSGTPTNFFWQAFA